MLFMLDIADAALPLLLAELKLTNTTDDKMPMIAMTTSNSINVKPLVYLFIFYGFINN